MTKHETQQNHTATNIISYTIDFDVIEVHRHNEIIHKHKAGLTTQK